MCVHECVFVFVLVCGARACVCVWACVCVCVRERLLPCMEVFAHCDHMFDH